MVAYVKIFVSFWQIMSTFESTYSTEWPNAVEQLWELGRGLSLNLFNFPGPNCLVEELGFLGVLQITTLVPAVVCLLLYIPTLILVLTGERKTKTFRYRNTRDHFWHACLFWLFLIYPIVSITSVQGLKCRQIGGTWWLEWDLIHECPWIHPSSATFVWSFISILLYPIGIPVFTYLQLLRKRIPDQAAKKREEACLHELLLQYKEYMSDSVYRKLAINIGGGQHHRDRRASRELILNRIRHMYDEASEPALGKRALTRRSFEQYLHGAGIEGAEADVQVLLSQFSVDDAGVISWEDFAAALLQIVSKENHVMAVTAIAAVSDQVLYDLCRFRWHNLDAARPNEANLKHDTAPLGAFDKGSSTSQSPSRARRDRSQGGVPGAFVGSLAADGGDSQHGAARAESHRLGQKGHAAALLLRENPTRDDMLDFLLYQASKLIAQGVISVPDVLWTGATQEEVEAMESLGFLFENYKVPHFYYELVEMGRKLAMTSLVIFLWPGSPEQIAIAIIVTGVALAHVLTQRPFANNRIGSLQAAMLSAQLGTLFYGLMLRVDALRGQLAGGEEKTVCSEVASGFILVCLSTAIFLLPPLTLLYDNRRELQKYCAPNTLRRQSTRTRTVGGAAGAVDPAASSTNFKFDALEAREDIARHAARSAPTCPLPAATAAATPASSNGNDNGVPLHRNGGSSSVPVPARPEVWEPSSRTFSQRHLNGVAAGGSSAGGSLQSTGMVPIQISSHNLNQLGAPQVEMVWGAGNGPVPAPHDAWTPRNQPTSLFQPLPFPLDYSGMVQPAAPASARANFNPVQNWGSALPPGAYNNFV